MAAKLNFTEEDYKIRKNFQKMELSTQTGIPEKSIREYFAGNYQLTDDQIIALNMAIEDQDYVVMKAPFTALQADYIYCYNITEKYLSAMMKEAAWPLLVGIESSESYWMAKGYKPRAIFCFGNVPPRFINLTKCPIILIDNDGEPQIVWTEVTTPFPNLSIALAMRMYYEYNNHLPLQLVISDMKEE